MYSSVRGEENICDSKNDYDPLFPDLLQRQCVSEVRGFWVAPPKLGKLDTDSVEMNALKM